VRWLVIAWLVACDGASPPVPARPRAPAPRTRANDPQAIDPIAALAPDLDGEQISWLVPGRA
jgi:hypothetical protein